VGGLLCALFAILSGVWFIVTELLKHFAWV
jgi:hypothetical protein